MDRRGFLGTMLAACAAPAIVRAGSLMRIATPEIIVPDMTVILQQYSALYAHTAVPMEIGRIEMIRFIVSGEIMPPVDSLGRRVVIDPGWKNRPPIYNAHWMKLK